MVERNMLIQAMLWIMRIELFQRRSLKINKEINFALELRLWVRHLRFILVLAANQKQQCHRKFPIKTSPWRRSGIWSFKPVF